MAFWLQQALGWLRGALFWERGNQVPCLCISCPCSLSLGFVNEPKEGQECSDTTRMAKRWLGDEPVDNSQRGC